MAAALSLHLAATFPIKVPPIFFPIVGNKWAVGSMFLFHIVLAAFSMGAVIIAPTYELLGALRKDARMDRYAHSLASTNLKLFSFGATLGAFAVLLLTALYGRLFISLISIFFIPMVIAFMSWILTFSCELAYVVLWRRMETRKPLHLALGWLGGITEQLFLFFIVGVDSFTLTPGRGQGTGAVFNASFWPEFAHRFVGNISWVSFIIAAVMAVFTAVTAEPLERAYYAWAARVSMAVGFLSLFPQVLLGAFYAHQIRSASPGAFDYSFRGPFSSFWLVQEAFLALILIGTSVHLWRSRLRGNPAVPALVGLEGLAAVAMILPSSVYPGALFYARYVALGVAMLITLALLALWAFPRGRAETRGRLGQGALAVAGVTAVLLFLFMGVIRETARGDYAVYGRMTQSQGQTLFSPPRGYYP
ncbi:MAG: cytochrome ubiquinol oxidase subunit I [Candidatus Dormibacterales bacterium]